MDQNIGPGRHAWLEFKLASVVHCYSKVTKVSMMQLSPTNVAELKPGTFRPQVCLRWSMPDEVKAKGKLMQSPSSLVPKELFVSASYQTDTRSKSRYLDYSGDLGEWEVGREPRFESCFTLLLIGLLSAMWAWWTRQDMDPNIGPGMDV